MLLKGVGSDIGFVNKKSKPFPEIVDPELKFIEDLFDDAVINSRSLIAPKGYSPPPRQILPCQLFRMDLLKVLKYPEISYGKFCTDESFGREGKQNRRFVRLPLNTKRQIDHTELSHFRSSLFFDTPHYLHKSGCIENSVVHGIDFGEIPMRIMGCSQSGHEFG